MRIFLFIYLLISSAGGCSSTAKHSNPLIGKWQFSGSYYSMGGPQVFKPAEENGSVEFGENGKLVNNNVLLFRDITAYQVIDSAKVKFMTPKESEGFLLYNYSIDSSGSLSFIPLTYLCVEGCSEVFKKMH